MSGPHGVGPPPCLCLLLGSGVDILRCTDEAPNAEACLCNARAVNDVQTTRTMMTTMMMKNKNKNKNNTRKKKTSKKTKKGLAWQLKLRAEPASL